VLVALATLAAGTLAWAVQAPETIVIAEPTQPSAAPHPVAPVQPVQPAPVQAPAGILGDNWDARAREDRAQIEQQMRAALESRPQVEQLPRSQSREHVRVIELQGDDQDQAARVIVERRVVAALSDAERAAHEAEIRANIRDSANERERHRVRVESRVRAHIDSGEMAELTAEITALAMELGHSALQMSQLEMRGALDEADRDRMHADMERLEAEIERHAEHLDQLGERLGEQMQEFDIELDGGEHD
jgi:hypothetical protein